MSILNLFNRNPKPEGLNLGKRIDGAPIIAPWPSPHILISGATGSGKSGWINSYIYQAAARPDTAIVANDLKQGMELQPWEPRLTDLAYEPTEATNVLSKVSKLVDTRCALMRGNQRMWTPNLGPWVLFVIDEYAELSDLDPKAIAKALDLSDIDRKEADQLLRTARANAKARKLLAESNARRARAAGVTLLISTQYATVEVVDAQIKSNTAIRIQGYVPSDEQIAVGLGEGHTDHVTPGSIAADEPGVAHLLGWDDYHKPRLGRAAYVTDQDVTAQVEATKHLKYSWADLLNPPTQKAG